MLQIYNREFPKTQYHYGSINHPVLIFRKIKTGWFLFIAL